ncbi:2-oxoglutarate dehydrogenase complex dihydrolipoyllysine-residue succinyltransferase [Rickettsia endosymbiont of Cardiosporidium cionae]|uniref:2-oxoglutarate dehydrogenase complex dihydrolipoyllysine-residue succinyltransferase n=1 Tax=Rickettsia endosymbiont of Cardiosporidium cionae TaxID=2777155 RepID=UPI0018940693|nr:2-oxoglutarate dehydrogenase complex dihydrolipoyllysine-residue succinyltransferase [Rickettsia endosymbiont of Cardiosporidium cionae]KAF8818308.1 dihydrolipoyllysine-residue succinyltransferase [Rickettsia endosymbiont of Cardiosporidium cionae]
MNVNVIVPNLGESISEATIAKWNKNIGDVVKSGELILELETEKVTLEINAPNNGVLETILKKEEDSVAIGEVVAIIKVIEDNSIQSYNSDKDKKNIQQSEDTHIKDDVLNKSGPAVKKIVKEHDINLSSIKATGKDGRLSMADVLGNINDPQITDVNKKDLIQDNKQNIDNNNKHNNVERVKLSKFRKTIAQRLKDSQNTAAILTTFNEINMSNVIALRQKYRDQFEKLHSAKLGFMSFFVKSVIRALQMIPVVNAEIDGEYIVYKKYYNIGVAVGTEQGLVVPVIKSADILSFAEIEKQIVSLADKARSGKLSISDFQDGTFSITNGGIYGSLLSTPIINPPQTAIIGLHNIQKRPIVDINNQIIIAPMMYVALSYDHRIIDGKDAVTFLVKVKQLIENPEQMLLEL